MARFAPKNTLPALGGLLGAALLIGYAPAAAEGAKPGCLRPVARLMLKCAEGQGIVTGK